MRNYAIVTSLLFLPSTAWAASIMDVGPLVSIVWFFLLLFIGIEIIKALLKSKSFKGWIGEFQVKQVVTKQLDADTYRQLHDITLPTEDGTTQIDHIIVSKFGIFVIETKNMSGWIFGRASDPKWTQSFRNHKSSFQNPLRQNYKHTKELNTLLGVGENKIFSVVVFVGDAEFKTDMPENVITGRRFVDYIRSKDTILFSDSDLDQIVLKINATMLQRSAETKRQHVRNLANKYGPNESDWQTGDLAPKLKIAAIALATFGALSLVNKATQPVAVPPTVTPVSIATPPHNEVPPPPVTRIAPQNQVSAPSVANIERPKPSKTPRSAEYGFLKLSAQRDTYITLYDSNNAEVVRMELKKGQEKEVEIRKGYYTAEILQAGKRDVTTVSFIGNTGVLEF